MRLLLGLLTVLCVGVAGAASINVDFGVSASSQPYVGQGAYVEDGNNFWNKVDLSTKAPFQVGPLKFSNGKALSRVTLTVPEVSRFEFGTIVFEPAGLMQDYAAADRASTFMLNGLEPGDPYTLYLYGAAFDGEGTSFTLNGQAKTSQSRTAGELDVRAGAAVGNGYVVFENVHADASGQISFTLDKVSGPAPFNGMQLVVSDPQKLISDVQAGRDSPEKPANVYGEPAVIPSPAAMRVEGGVMTIGPGSRVVAMDIALVPLARVLVEDVRRLTGMTLGVVRNTALPGDIVLRFDDAMDGEKHTVAVADQVVVAGGNYHAVAMGTASVLQLLRQANGVVTIPRLHIEDQPVAPYRGLMVDLGRQWHGIDSLRELVVLCRLYKVRYLHLHFSDDQLFTFPSSKYPQVATRNRHYTLGQLRDLEAFSRDRGVVIVPELDVPGHSSALLEAMPELGESYPTGMVTPGRELTYEVLGALIGEMLDVFQSTPYFHIGADEVNVSFWDSSPDCQAYLAANGLENNEQLYRHFIVRMNSIVKKHGKQMIVWEGFDPRGKPEIPKDVTVMVFESLYATAPELLDAGYRVINTSWQPLYVVNARNWSPRYIYGWDMYRFENWWDQSRAYPGGITVEPTDRVIGAQLCAWEQSQERELPSLRRRLPTMIERVWNSSVGASYEKFEVSLEQTDEILSRLLDATPGVTSGGVILGSVKPGQIEPLGGVHDFDATFFLDKPGRYAVSLGHEFGTDPVSIDRVALLLDGRVVSQDEHESTISYLGPRSTYIMEITDHKPVAGSLYTLRVWCRGGGDSHIKLMVDRVR